MDFDDLLLHPLTLFSASIRNASPTGRTGFSTSWWTNFQDTNAAQYLLVRHLAKQHGNLCVVGDDDQAIYGWRGADVRHMLTFQNDFPGAKLVRLEQNYPVDPDHPRRGQRHHRREHGASGQDAVHGEEGCDPVTLAQHGR